MLCFCINTSIHDKKRMLCRFYSSRYALRYDASYSVIMLYIYICYLTIPVAGSYTPHDFFLARDLCSIYMEAIVILGSVIEAVIMFATVEEFCAEVMCFGGCCDICCVLEVMVAIYSEYGVFM